jgi:hypothetical protein
MRLVNRFHGNEGHGLGLCFNILIGNIDMTVLSYSLFICFMNYINSSYLRGGTFRNENRINIDILDVIL